jgi:two-component system response regulator HydG
MKASNTLLIVDDNKSILTTLQFLLSDYFEHILSLSSPQGILSLLDREQVDVILLDMNFSAGINSGNEGLFWLQEIKKRHAALPVVLFTAYADIELAVEGIKRGAADFIVKPWDNAKMIHTLQEAVRHCASDGRKNNGGSSSKHKMYWGESDVMKRLRDQVERCSSTDANILITGENGTGKEMLAQEIHALSARREGPMVSVDMGAITDTLFESELFGHVKGAFTDAHTDRTGRFEAAHGGTLFLDEIGNLPMHLQSKLLTVLQRRQIVRVGSNRPVDVDIRLVCATNRHLDEMVAREEFREDLLYRINTIHLFLPPLRERAEDILPLAERFLQRYAQMYGRHLTGFTPEAVECLNRALWPGNIRELQHVVERAVIMSDDTLKLIPADNLNIPKRVPEEAGHPDNSQIQTLEEMELSAIRQALEHNRGNYSLAASQLGISRQTLYNKIKRYGL